MLPVVLLTLTGCSESPELTLTDNVIKSKVETAVMSRADDMPVSLDMYRVTKEDAIKFSKTIRRGEAFQIDPYVVERDTLLYIVNFPKGWIIIAGDRRINPIVAESAKDQICLRSLNEEVSVWIDSYADEVRVIRSDKRKVENEHTRLWSMVSPSQTTAGKTTRNDVTYKWAVVSYTQCDSESDSILLPHMIETKWGQLLPWEERLPMDASFGNTRCPIGCTPVALSQMIYYMHYSIGVPTGLYHTISIAKAVIPGKTADIGFSRSSYNSNSNRWQYMSKDLNDTILHEKSYVQDLMMDVGNRLGAKYSADGTTATPSTSAMSYYGLTFNTSGYDYPSVRADLFNSIPVVVSAKRLLLGTNTKSGHSWIIDGIAIKTRHFVTTKTFEYTENWMHEPEYYDTFDELRQHYHINSEFDSVVEDGGFSTIEYLLMNWGGDGAGDNGYYSTYPSSGWGPSDAEYKYNKTIYYNFRKK